MRTILAGIITLFLTGHVWAANFSDPIDGIFKGVYGNEISVQVPATESKSPSNTVDQEGDLSFKYNASTYYNNFSQLSDLKVGDPVRVEYIQDPSRNKADLVATSITKLVNERVVTPSTTTTSVTTAPTYPSAAITTTTTTRNPPQ